MALEFPFHTPLKKDPKPEELARLIEGIFKVPDDPEEAQEEAWMIQAEFDRAIAYEAGEGNIVRAVQILVQRAVDNAGIALAERG